MDTGLPADTAFSYAVRAIDAAGNASALCAAVTARTQATPTGVVRVQYRNNSVPTGDQEIKPGLQVVNGGTAPLALNTVAVRYYFTRDGGSYAIWCDWALAGCGNLATRVVNLPSAVNGADAYIEVTFTGGTVAPGGSSGEIQLRVSRTDWQPVNETNDYSRGAGTSLADAPAVPAFVGGSLAWGVVPA
ncbi:cellulose binding domain-containing protein [Dactylosporangium sp. NBC_01737]|uniref:cellulose binding domain-containing protein n=1 Tax=Dactylosporangium sp. NBC_01737 TaxID=2975959 RepID=UPI003FA3B152